MSTIGTLTGGRDFVSRTGDQVQLAAPGSNIDLGQVTLASAADVHLAAAAAADAQPAWANTPVAERAEVLTRVELLLLERAETLLPGIAQETGSTFAKAQIELDGSVKELRAARALAAMPDGQVFPSPAGAMSYTRRIPLGVVGLITPWNFPVALAMRVIAPALLLGNAVLIKPDPQTPVSGGDMLVGLFAEAGLPEGLLTSLPGGAEVGEALVRDEHTAMISFTGSTAAGRKVGALAASLLKKVSLELGGNNPMIVLDCVDTATAGAAGALGSFTHQGQICMSTGRHIVHSSVKDGYVEALRREASAHRIGSTDDPSVTLGPIMNDKQLERLTDIVDRSVAMGAEVICGGNHEGLYYSPTVLTGVTKEMPAFSEELFGPVAVVTAFDTDDEAVELANTGEHGLAASVFGDDLARARKIAQRLRAGMVHINAITITDTALTPMGGHGSSGNSTSIGGLANIEEFTQVRWYTEQNKPFDVSF